MKPVYAPSYYRQFSCIASACRHSCCVGWEIDVDKESLIRYDAVEGSLGDRLKACIDRKADPPCLILTPDERCPFLNRNGLCDLITELGEQSLCHICADHPRFRNILPDRVELGLGMCCEAAAALILSQTKPMEITALPPAEAARDRFSREEMEETDRDLEEALRLRDQALRIAMDREYSLGERIKMLCETMGVPRCYPRFAYAEWSEILLDTEELDPARRTLFEALATLPESPDGELIEEYSLPYENLLCYFLYRYTAAEGRSLADWSIPTRIGFAVLSTILVHAMARVNQMTDLEGLCEIARVYSSEVEYSEENLDYLWDILQEDTPLLPTDRLS